MILTKLALKTCKTQLDGLGYTSFLYLAPQDADYPFVTFFPVASSIEYTFGQNKEDVQMQISIFTAQSDVENGLDMAEEIENAFDELKTTDGDYTLYCTHRTNEAGPTYLSKENYWQIDIDLTFFLIKPKT